MNMWEYIKLKLILRAKSFYLLSDFDLSLYPSTKNLN